MWLLLKDTGQRLFNVHNSRDPLLNKTRSRIKKTVNLSRANLINYVHFQIKNPF